jgi:DNA adenine methylase
VTTLPFLEPAGRPAKPGARGGSEQARLPRPAPIVKWAGGKAGLLRQLEPLLPPGVERRRYVEPFLGGGAMFFHLGPKRALLSDINPALIATYQQVRDDVESVIAQLERLARNHSTEAYYRVRTSYNCAKNLSAAQRAAAFIYLNKTCFNGLHRVNRKGHFNVPLGRYARPGIANPAALRAASGELGRAELDCQPFESMLKKARPGDFIYMDPPYEPLSTSSNFTSYARDGFGPGDQGLLRDVFTELDRRGCKLMLSNSDVPVIRELYRRFRIDRVAALRAINCDACNRGRISELVIRNYG